MRLIFFFLVIFIAPVDTSPPAVILDKPTDFPMSVYGLYSIFSSLLLHLGSPVFVPCYAQTLNPPPQEKVFAWNLL